jgi:uncharacterized protein (TIGR03546 family)
MKRPSFKRPRSLREAYDRFLKIRGEPRDIAMGFALGLFVGMTPFMGFQTIIVLPLAALFKANKISAAAAVWISNPLTAPVLYGITYFTGAKLFGLSRIGPPPPHLENISLLHLFQKAPHVLNMMIVGGVVLGIPLAIAGYFFALKAVKKYRQDIKRRLPIGKKKRAEQQDPPN